MVTPTLPASPPVIMPGLRILIVDDRADSADSLALLLGMYGHEVDVARDGVSGLQQALADEPDVVLLDVGLPGMNGYDVAKQINNHRPSEKMPLLIAVTGYGREQDRRHSRESGIHLHLVKPVDPAELATLLKRFQELIYKRAPEQ